MDIPFFEHSYKSSFPFLSFSLKDLRIGTTKEYVPEKFSIFKFSNLLSYMQSEEEVVV